MTVTIDKLDITEKLVELLVSWFPSDKDSDAKSETYAYSLNSVTRFLMKKMPSFSENEMKYISNCLSNLAELQDDLEAISRELG